MWNDLVSFAQRCHARVLTFELRSEDGQGLVEYALIISLISIAAIGAMTLLGVKIGAVFTEIEGKL